MTIFTGNAHIYGDNIDTDRIIPGKYTKTLDLSQLAAHAMEDIDPEFAKRVKKGDILVAGHNFGCGSSREQAPLALQAAGISVVVASSFARIFYRNAINIGLPAVEVGDHRTEMGDLVSVDLERGVLINTLTKHEAPLTKMPAVMRDILAEGGLVNYLRKHGNYK